MPFKLIDTDCTPLVIDNEYEIVDKKLLAKYVGELLLGNHKHIMRIINSLSTTLPEHPDNSINAVIKQLKSTSVEKRHGWLFQMISWIVLSERNQGTKFYSNYPHFAPAQQGIDGLALIIGKDETLQRIIITEDKCTTHPRNKITQQVFPELEDFESGKKDSALVGIISSLIGELNSGELLEKVQNEIFNKDIRMYRIGITRDSTHNSVEGRKKLFKDYDQKVKGKLVQRRSAASINIPELRKWMEKFSDSVEEYLNSKKTKNV